MSDESPPIRVEATRVAFEMASGRLLTLPSSYGQIHDQEGKILPKCQIFFGPFKKTRRPVKMNSSHRRYFGTDYRATLAVLPDIPMDGWKKIGEVAQIFYVRKGTRAPGGFHHPYKSEHRPVLYKSGRLYKLDLGEHCRVDDRGYRWP
jgi:hypothetical protein